MARRAPWEVSCDASGTVPGDRPRRPKLFQLFATDRSASRIHAVVATMDEESEAVSPAVPNGTGTPSVEQLWALHQRSVSAVLLAHGCRLADLPDLMQDVALTLLQKRQQLRKRDALAPWLRSVAINALRAVQRRHASGPGRVNHGQPGAANGQPACLHNHATELEAQDEGAWRGQRAQKPDQVLLEQSELELALARMADLPLEQREVLSMRCLGEMSQAAIAESLGLSIEAVESRLARARRKLRAAASADAETAQHGPRTTGSTSRRAGQTSNSNWNRKEGNQA